MSEPTDFQEDRRLRSSGAEGPTGSDPRLHAYIADLFCEEDELLVELREALEEKGFPVIHVPAITGKTLQVLVKAAGARRVLEVGTLGGYSAIWMARALPGDGELVTVEKSPEHAELAREFVRRAGLEDLIRVRVGDARDEMAALGPDGSFDVVFLDADKESYADYLAEARRLLRPGGLLIADNALWKGKVLEEGGSEADRGIRAFNRALAEGSGFTAMILPVGDGVAVGVKE